LLLIKVKQIHQTKPLYFVEALKQNTVNYQFLISKEGRLTDRDVAFFFLWDSDNLSIAGFTYHACALIPI